MAGRHSRKRRRRKSMIATIFYFLAVLLIVCSLGFLYRENRQKREVYQAQQQELMEEERISGSPREQK